MISTPTLISLLYIVKGGLISYLTEANSLGFLLEDLRRCTWSHIWYFDPIMLEVIVPTKLSSDGDAIPFVFWAIVNSDLPLLLRWCATASFRFCRPLPSYEKQCLESFIKFAVTNKWIQDWKWSYICIQCVQSSSIKRWFLHYDACTSPNINRQRPTQQGPEKKQSPKRENFKIPTYILNQENDATKSNPNIKPIRQSGPRRNRGSFRIRVVPHIDGVRFLWINRWPRRQSDKRIGLVLFHTQLKRRRLQQIVLHLRLPTWNLFQDWIFPLCIFILITTHFPGLHIRGGVLLVITSNSR